MKESKKLSKAGCLLRLLAALCFVIVLLGLILPQIANSPCYDNRSGSKNNARRIGKAWNSVRKKGDSVNAQSIHDWAAILAQKTDLNTPSVWSLDFDPLVSDILGMGGIYPDSIFVKKGDSFETNEAFKAFPVSFEVVNGLSGKIPGNTPILWTRGLKPDGTWNKDDGLFADKGGHIVFADMSVKWFDSLKDSENPKGVLVKYGTKEPTFNIFEAIPGGEESVLKSQ